MMLPARCPSFGVSPVLPLLPCQVTSYNIQKGLQVDATLDCLRGAQEKSTCEKWPAGDGIKSKATFQVLQNMQKSHGMFDRY